MNIFRRIAVFAGSGLILIGVFLMILSAAFGGKISYSDKGGRIDIDSTYENVASLDIDYRSGTLSIKKGESFRIVATNVLKNRFKSSVTDGVWTITDKKEGSFSFLSGMSWNNDTSVTIYLPPEVILDECVFQLGAGKVDADQINTKILDAQVGAGELKVKNLNATDSDLNCGVGTINIEGVISGASVVKCGVGRITLSLKGDPDTYDYKLKVGIGSTKINDVKYSGIIDKEIKNDDSTGSFDLDCGIGEIDLMLAP
ncbi:MAG: DUF4097 family beta strand repeat-containing protein [Saccharofermentanales bacterium]